MARWLEARIGDRPLARVRVADNPWTRLVGLLRTPHLPEAEGLLIRPCGAVHTLGMAYPIDVLFLSRDGEVLKIDHGLPPGRPGSRARGAKQVVELAEGAAARFGVAVGDRLEFAPASSP